MAKKAKSLGFSIRGFDRNHYRQTEGYIQAIDQLYNSAIHSFSRLAGSVKVDPDKPFDFANSPAFQRRAQKIVDELAQSMTAVIQHGTREQWLYACKKNDALINHIMDTSKVGKRQLKKMQDKNLDALDAFQHRKVQGLDLSQRVWHYAGQTKGLMEMGIDIAVGDGRSAEELSRDLREYLVEPDKLFRRVRDKHGNLVLSKRAAAYHPGQGVYRSSYKNAMRLARTEVNMAYRDSDRYRWNNMDFVVGFRVHLSNNHTLNGEPFHDICDELAGDYPKNFIFKGWHPHCRCFVTPILQDPDEFNTDELNEMKAAFFGTEYKKFPSRKTVPDVPKGFKEWVDKNKEKSKNWSKQPYWIRDNFKGGTLEGGLLLKKPIIPQPIDTPKRFMDLSDQEQKDLRTRWENMYSRELFGQIKDACGYYHVDGSLFFDLDSSMMENYKEMDRLESEFSHITGELDRVAESMWNDAKRLETESINITNECNIWSDLGADIQSIRDLCQMFHERSRWPKYDGLLDVLKKIIDKSKHDIQEGKKQYDSATLDAAAVITKAEKLRIDVSKLKDLAKTQPTASRSATKLVGEIRAEIKRVNALIDAEDPGGEWTDIMEFGRVNKVEYRDVAKLDHELTKEEIINRVGGGDMTTGSCSSLAFTYAANRSGLDVLDFRGGSSTDMFSRSDNIMNIATKLGGVVINGKNQINLGKDLLAKVEKGKEYYFTCGAHAAIVRRTENGLEYLELQSATRNGFHPLNEDVLKWRFGAKKSRTRYGFKLSSDECLIDVELFKKNAAFRKMMGYINTSEGTQHKGRSGSMK